MSELTILAWTVVLAIVQILLATAVATNDQGLGYNMGPRDEAGKTLSTLGCRLVRAQNNLFQTFPLFAAAVLIAHAMGRETGMTLLGAEIFLAARVIYVPLYALGVPVLRTLCWLASVVGLVMILVAILHP
jgi:uncharacterized MAPEG superfamily protein